ncbi:MAG TPA: hypothetical protein PLM53_09155 [Spirochaetota bacterium]|nr:hypothetical protein [Spirochaetota bacterium]HPC40105.1 hypothetical protein [Spirochaetota bacterium]HPL15847.1 hypothetical protein [Spirochaetota bacterium]HQF08509.1 hypothetical protein [Spirochaetota bacterium]HQH97254.1 hypothetical protein [Spirochaetota bacterium]
MFSLPITFTRIGVMQMINRDHQTPVVRCATRSLNRNTMAMPRSTKKQVASTVRGMSTRN